MNSSVVYSSSSIWDLGVQFTIPSTHPLTTLTIHRGSHRSQILGGTIMTKDIKYIKYATSRGGSQ